MAAKKNSRKKSSAKKSSPKRNTLKSKRGKKPVSKRRSTPKNRARGRGKAVSRALPSRRRAPASPAGQSGALQGLSSTAQADSESTDELLEEGNAFEAGVVEGVEEADDAGEREVHTREVPEDDVPGEYLDED